MYTYLCSLCKCSKFSCRTSVWMLPRMVNASLRQHTFRRWCGTTWKLKQIKYYWGWCHPHKNAWKLGKHVSKLFLAFQLKRKKMFNNFYVEIDFSQKSFQRPFPFALAGLEMFPLECHDKNPSLEERTQRPEDVVWKSAFRRISHQYQCAPQTVQAVMLLGLKRDK